MDRSSRQKINKETEALNDTLDQTDLTDIYRAFHPKKSRFHFFSQVHMEYSLRYITSWVTNQALVSLKKYIIEIISSIFSDHKAIRLHISNRKKNIGDTRDVDLIPGSGDSLEEEMETFFNTLAGVILLPEEPGGLHYMGSQRTGCY